jgi:hypothetical protein
MVWPVQAEPASDHEWRMALRCGACGSTREALVADADAAVFDRDLTRQVTEIEAQLAALEEERMAGELHALRVALERALIDASDFSR